MNRETALKWLYDRLREKRRSIGRAEGKPNVSPAELEALRTSAEVIEWIIGKVLEGEEHGN